MGRAAAVDQVAHLVHTASAGQAATIAAGPPRAGHVYATSGSGANPWQVVPDYLGDFKEQLEAC